MYPRRPNGAQPSLFTLAGMAQLNTRRSPRDPAPGQIPRPTARQWLLHALLFLVTAVTTTICGIVMAGPDLAPIASPPTVLRGVAGTILSIPWIYLMTVVELVRYAFIHPQIL
ncbi:MAG TPA: hypothetical protein VKD91_13225, partial [Pyrinomonadaceae bacterium]|nr:hypothetical protein [Pyrinomonadaceae bacterium]